MLPTLDLPYLAFVFILHVHETTPLSLCDSVNWCSRWTVTTIVVDDDYNWIMTHCLQCILKYGSTSRGSQKLQTAVCCRAGNPRKIMGQSWHQFYAHGWLYRFKQWHLISLTSPSLIHYTCSLMWHAFHVISDTRYQVVKNIPMFYM
jgi:hypothetical protein